MNRKITLPWILTCAPLCALLACGDPENLSIGEVRCEGVPCDPIEVEPVEEELFEVEHVDREEMLTPVIRSEPFCPGLEGLTGLRDDDDKLARFCGGDKLIYVGDEQVIVATKYSIELESERVESGIRFARYSGHQLLWENKELNRTLALVSGFFGDSFAVASGGAPGEVIVGMTREQGKHRAYGQTFYTLTAGGQVVELFEDESAGRIHDVAMLGEDIIAASEYEGRIEVTRYTDRGVIVWRQTTMTLGEESPDVAVLDQWQTVLRVIDEGRVLALVPRTNTYQLIELTAEGALVRSWMSRGIGFNQGAVFGARLAVGPDGHFVVGFDGYDILRGTLDGDEPRIERFEKQRTQFYTPAVFGLHVDRAGYIYVGTIDGIRDQSYGLLERISPDLSRRDSFVIDGGPLTLMGGLVIGGEMFVTEDRRALYIAAGGSVAAFELPPPEEPASLGD